VKVLPASWDWDRVHNLYCGVLLGPDCPVHGTFEVECIGQCGEAHSPELLTGLQLDTNLGSAPEAETELLPGSEAIRYVRRGAGLYQVLRCTVGGERWLVLAHVECRECDQQVPGVKVEDDGRCWCGATLPR
jgi:hypothetical protein